MSQCCQKKACVVGGRVGCYAAFVTLALFCAGCARYLSPSGSDESPGRADLGTFVGDGGSAEESTPAPTVDGSVDAAPLDVSVDGTVDTRTSDSTLDTLAPDTTVDTLAPDSTVDTLPPDTGCVPDCAGKGCNEADTCGGFCTLNCDALSYRAAGGYGDANAQVGHAVAIDGAGNVTVCGEFYGSVDFGGGVLASAGASDIFVASYDASGAHRWSRRFGSAGVIDVGTGIAVDGAGNVIVTGYFGGGVDFGGGALDANGLDTVVAVFAANGAHQRSMRFGGPDGDLAAGVAADSAGNFAIVGSFYNSIDFGGSSLTTNGIYDVYVAAFDADGTHRWSRSAGSTGQDYGRAVAMDSSGKVAITGSFSGTADFGAGPQNAVGLADIFVAQYASNGTHVWSKTLGSTAGESGYGIGLRDDGTVTIGGYIVDAVDFGGGASITGGGFTAFVASYDSGGLYRWARTITSIGSVYAYGVAQDASGNVFVTGYYQQSADFGDGSPLSASGSDIFVASYGLNGAYRGAAGFGGPGPDRGHGVAVNGSGRVAVTGDFQNTVDFGGGPVSSGGDYDVFVLQLDQ